MVTLRVVNFISFIFHIVKTSPSSLANGPATCTVQSQGYEIIDDSPAINDAIRQCGDGGTVILPETQVYSIRSPIDFSPCHNCDVQLEGQLSLYTDWAYWLDKPSFISMAGVSGARMRSTTGTGAINGNAKGFYQRYRDPDPYRNQPVIVSITNSSHIDISGLALKDAPRTFFRVDDQSKSVYFNDLALTVEDQWYQETWTHLENYGFQFRNSSDISVWNVSVAMHSTDASSHVGVCIQIDFATDDIRITNIKCDNTIDGVNVQFGRFDTAYTPPAAEFQYANNIRIINYTANSAGNNGWSGNGGFALPIDFLNATVTNLTYDNVQVLDGAPLQNILTSNTHNVYVNPGNDLHQVFTNVWFKNFRGKVQGNRYGWGAKLGCWWKCDFHFEGWEL